ncbi:MAG: hypothetical protein AABY22_34635 [Nanoarchaeota archaeon]
MKIEKQTTNNGLARMISRGFAGVDKRFEEMEKRFDKRFNEMDARFDKIEKIVLVDYKHRLEQVESDMRLLKSALAI